MKRLISIALTSLFGLAVAQTSPVPADRSPPPVAGAASAGGVSQFTLANGMTVIVKPDRRAPTVVHMVWLRVGPIDEVDGTSGVAHVVEHMLFKGTPNLKPGEFSRRVAALGGRENAFTGRDYTGYFQQIPAGKLEEVMKLEVDRFARNQWPDEEFVKEIEVVKEERRLRTEDNPRALLGELLNATAFVASPYQRPVIGWMNDLDAMTPADVRDFYRRWYVPANAAVVVVGDVDLPAVRQLAEKHYGSLPAGAVPPRKPRLEPPQQGLRRVELKAPAEQAYLSMMFKAPQLTSPDAQDAASRDALALTVLSAVLSGYNGARIDRALTQGRDRVADSAGSYNGLTGRGPQVFGLYGVPAPGKTVQQLEAALREQVARVARDGISETELNRVKVGWVANEVYKLDSIMNQARELGAHWTLGFAPDAGDRILARLRAVSAAEVQSVAARYFGDDQLTLAVLLPQPVDPQRRPRVPAAGARH